MPVTVHPEPWNTAEHTTAGTYHNVNKARTPTRSVPNVVSPSTGSYRASGPQTAGGNYAVSPAVNERLSSFYLQGTEVVSAIRGLL